MGVSAPVIFAPMKSSCPRDSTSFSSTPNRSSKASLGSRWRTAVEPTPYRKARSRASRIRRDSLPVLALSATVRWSISSARAAPLYPRSRISSCNNVMSLMWYVFFTSLLSSMPCNDSLHGDVLLPRKLDSAMNPAKSMFPVTSHPA